MIDRVCRPCPRSHIPPEPIHRSIHTYTRHLTALSAIGADAAQAVAQIQALRLQLLLPPPLPRTAPDEAHARMEAGGEEEDPELEAVDGLLAALRARAEVQASQARAVGDGWKEELRARRALHRAVVSAAAAAGGQSGAAVEGPKAMMEQAEGEEEDRVWALLAERLKQLGVHRLAAALRECASLGGSSRPGSSCGGGGGSFSLPSSAHPTPGHSRPGSAASLLACVPEVGGRVGGRGMDGRIPFVLTYSCVYVTDAPAVPRRPR